MNITLNYSPIEWQPAMRSNWKAPAAFLEVLEVFNVEHDARTLKKSSLDFEVDREGLKRMRAALIEGDFDSWQNTIYANCLESFECAHDEFIKILTEILSAKTERIHINWH